MLRRTISATRLSTFTGSMAPGAKYSLNKYHNARDNTKITTTYRIHKGNDTNNINARKQHKHKSTMPKKLAFKHNNTNNNSNDNNTNNHNNSNNNNNKNNNNNNIITGDAKEATSIHFINTG